MQKDNMLREMFKIQKDFNKDLINIKSVKGKEEKTKQYVLAGMAEFTELLSEINWTTWKNKIKVIDSNIKDEIIDVQKFLMNCAIIWGMDYEEFFNEFVRKSNVVFQRKKQMEELANIKKYKKKVCAIDLDGVLCEYPEYFIQYVNRRLKRKFVTLYDLKKNVTNKKYLSLQDEYRRSGAKQHMPLKQNAKGFIDKLRKLGYSIVILTARPYKQYFRIFADTKFNLDKNKIKYDAILFDSEKHKKIVKEFPKLKFIVEDNRRIVNEVGEWGYKAFLIDNIYNQGELNKNVKRVKDFTEILKEIA